MTRRRLLISLPVLLLVAAAGVALGRGFDTLCRRPVDVYPTIVAARDQAEAAAGASSEEGPTRAIPIAGAHLLDVILQVKQSDYLAFPAHVMAGYALEAARCPATSSGAQWRKAAAHAWGTLPARLAAQGLQRTLTQALGQDALTRSVRQYAQDEPWHAANLTRVEHDLAPSRDTVLVRAH